MCKGDKTPLVFAFQIRRRAGLVQVAAVGIQDHGQGHILYGQAAHRLTAPVSYTHLDVYKRQVCYRSSAAILGTAFLQSIYGTAEMSSMMILGSVPLYNVMAVVILMLEGPEAAQAGSMTAKLKKSVKGILTNPTSVSYTHLAASAAP